MHYILLLLFVFSSICSLIFEVIWARMLAPVFGNTVYAATIVITTFMAGLAIGGFAGGRYAEKSKNPLVLFTVSQFLIGIYAFSTPFLISLIKSFYIYLAGQYEFSLFYFLVNYEYYLQVAEWSSIHLKLVHAPRLFYQIVY